jgi:hypothetical protein
MPNTYSTAVTATIVQFIESIGIPVVFNTITEETFVPGILINKGSLVVDKNQLLYPGDLLHEAGHIAVAMPADREAMHGDVGKMTEKSKSDGEEMMAIAWSYAACVHLSIDPAVVFHPHGYKGASDWYLEQFTSGNPLYIPLMQWAGFCFDAANAAKKGVEPFPAMMNWLRN